MPRGKIISKRSLCPSGQNNLLSTLPAADRRLIEGHLTPVSLKRGLMLKQPYKMVNTAVFPISGVASMLARNGRDRFIEVGLFGRDGMSGWSVLAGAGCSPLETFMQIAGDGLSIEADRLRSLLDHSPSLYRHLLLYLQVLLVQMSHTVLANGKAKLEERLARWLLMCHDRIDSDRLELTHNSIAVMLGVRRAGVTAATHLFEGERLICANRGEIVILDRSGLAERARGFYGIPEAEYERLFGGKSSGPIQSGETSGSGHRNAQRFFDVM